MNQPPSLTATVFVTSLIASAALAGPPGAAVTLTRDAALELPAWGYAVYVR